MLQACPAPPLSPLDTQRTWGAALLVFYGSVLTKWHTTTGDTVDTAAVIKEMGRADFVVLALETTKWSTGRRGHSDPACALSCRRSHRTMHWGRSNQFPIHRGGGGRAL
jgi:hypothetical protein